MQPGVSHPLGKCTVPKFCLTVSGIRALVPIGILADGALVSVAPVSGRLIIDVNDSSVFVEIDGNPSGIEGPLVAPRLRRGSSVR